MELLEDRYVTNLPGKVTFGVSSQHYTFTENAFVELVSVLDKNDTLFIIMKPEHIRYWMM